MACQQDVRRIALALPGARQRAGESGAYRVNGKLFAWTWQERVEPKRARVPNPEVLAVRVASDAEKSALLSLDNVKFFTEPHYDGYPAVLVRIARVDKDELAELLTGSWRTRATRKLVAELEGRSGR